MHRPKCWSLKIITIGSLGLAASAQTPRYHITDVSAPFGRHCWATGINDAGQVSGSFWTAAWDEYGYIWTNGVTARMPANGSEANAINARGNVCGWLGLQGAIWNPNGMTITYWSPGVCEKGLALNDADTVAGEYYSDWTFETAYAFVYSGGASVQPIGFSGQSGAGSGRGINALGHVTGWSETGGAMHMFLYRDGVMLDCGLFPGSTETGGYAITDTDVIAGYFVAAGRSHAVVRDFDAQRWIVLGEPPGALASVARAINGAGELAGSVMLSDGAWHACRWDSAGAVHLLENEVALEPGSTLSIASGINEAGQIVGEGVRSNLRRAFLLTLAAMRGDLNCDGVISVGDIGPFVLALTDPSAYAAQFPNCDMSSADLNGDSFVTVGDIAPFVSLLVGRD